LKVRQGCCILLTILSFEGSTLFAQQTSGLTQFFVNASSLNPSYTAIDGRPAAFLGYRKQWAGLEGSPTIGYFNLQAPLPSNVLLGATFVSDKKGLINTSSVLFTGGYSVSLANERYLRFALSLGGAWNKVDVGNLFFVNQSDPVLANLASSNAELLGNAGISFHTKTFHGGLTIPTILEPTYVATDGFTIAKVNPLQSLVFNLSNRFYFAKGKNAVEPYLIYRLNSTLPSQIEFATVLHLQNKVWVGGSFKQDFGISALAGVKLSKVSALGYSYTVKNSGDNQVSFPSHEIQLALLFGKHKKNTPMYSFVNTEVEKHKKTPQELLAEKKKKEEALALEKKKKEDALAAAEKKKQDEARALAEKKKKEEEGAAAALAEKKKQEEALAKKPDPIVETKVEEKPLPEHTGGPRKRANAGLIELIPLDSVPEQERDQHLHEQELMNKLEEHKDDPAAVHAEAAADEGRHEFVKRGDHPEEMNLADYIIIGAFRSKENAERYDKQMVGMGYPEVHFGFLTARNLWYVYVASANDINEARAARDKYKKLKMFKDAWLLTVHE
jgi:type IX secretion system PorP/SprF family membrane protein